MRSLPVEELQPGMILARSIINDEMMVILSEGTLLSKAHITRLGFLDIPFVYVKDEYELSEAFQNVSALFDEGSAFVSEYKDVIHEARSIFEEAKSSGKAPVEKSKEVVKDTIAPMAKQSGVMDYLLEVNHLATDVYNHSVRVSIISGVLAKWMHLSANETQEVILAGFLHDIGKIGIPDAVINNTGKLSDSEYEMIKSHSRVGARILRKIEEMPRLLEGARWHHEWYNGAGYPDGLAGDSIPEPARIIAVADAYDAMSSERRYRSGMPESDIRKEIEKGKGTQFDPRFAEIMLSLMDDGLAPIHQASVVP